MEGSSLRECKEWKDIECDDCGSVAVSCVWWPKARWGKLQKILTPEQLARKRQRENDAAERARPAAERRELIAKRDAILERIAALLEEDKDSTVTGLSDPQLVAAVNEVLAKRGWQIAIEGDEATIVQASTLPLPAMGNVENASGLPVTVKAG